MTDPRRFPSMKFGAWEGTVKTTILNVRDCGACGKDHVGLKFYKFAAPVYWNSLPYFWGATCPQTGETILSDYLDPEDIDPRIAGKGSRREARPL